MTIRSCFVSWLQVATLLHTVYRAMLALLFRLNSRWLPSILRCAFETCVLRVDSWRESDEEKAAHQIAFDRRIGSRIDSELAWLRAEASEPSWPSFPTKRAIPKRRGLSLKAIETTETLEADEVQERVNYHLAALWLKQHKQFFREVAIPSWLVEIAATYVGWTLLANGKGGDKGDRYDRGPSEWNNVSSNCCRDV